MKFHLWKLNYTWKKSWSLQYMNLSIKIKKLSLAALSCRCKEYSANLRYCDIIGDLLFAFSQKDIPAENFLELRERRENRWGSPLTFSLIVLITLKFNGIWTRERDIEYLESSLFSTLMCKSRLQYRFLQWFATQFRVHNRVSPLKSISA